MTESTLPRSKCGINARNVRTPSEKKMSDALCKVANEIGACSISAVALAYLMHKTPYVPIVVGRMVAHLANNVKTLEIRLR